MLGHCLVLCFNWQDPIQGSTPMPQWSDVFFFFLGVGVVFGGFLPNYRPTACIVLRSDVMHQKGPIMCNILQKKLVVKMILNDYQQFNEPYMGRTFGCISPIPMQKNKM